MWCLETIKAVNKELAKGKNLKEAEKACGIKYPVVKGDEKPVNHECNGKKVA